MELSSDAVTAPTVYATRGIIGLSARAYPVETCDRRPSSGVGPGTDFVGMCPLTPSTAADRAATDVVRVYRKLCLALEADGLQVSTSKTHFMEKQSGLSARSLGRVTPPFATLVRIWVLRWPKKAGARLTKLHSLRIPQPKVRSRLFSMSILAAGNWEHQSQGVSPGDAFQAAHLWARCHGQCGGCPGDETW